jgi:hypothetical protein
VVLINEETQAMLSMKLGKPKLNEAREQVRAEMRDEFAQRYEHDKGQ